MKLSEAFATYRLEVILYRNQSRKTEEHHQVALKSLIRFAGDLEIENLTFDTVRRWKNALELQRKSSGTIYGYIVRLRCVLAYLGKQGHDCLHPDQIPPPKRIKRAPGFLTEQEVWLLIRTALETRGKFKAKRNAAIVSLIFSSGIRVSELVRMNRSDVHYDTFVVFGKGGKSRPCFIDARTRELLNAYLALRKDHSEALWVSEATRERLTVGIVQLVFRNLRQRSGITKHVTPHTERHSFATNFLRNNGNMRYLQVMMGHESLETTQIYAQVVDEDLRSVHNKYHTI